MAYQQQATYQYDTQQYYATPQTAAYSSYSTQTPSSQTAYDTSYTGQNASYAAYSTASSNAGQGSVSNVNQSTAYQSGTSSYYQPSYSAGTTTTTTTQASTTTSYYTQQPASQPTQSYDAYQAYYQASAVPAAGSSYQGQSYYAHSQPQAQAQGVANSTASYNYTTPNSTAVSSTSGSTSYTSAYGNTYAYGANQQQPSQTSTQNQYYDYSNYGTQATTTATASTSYYGSSQYSAPKPNPSSYTTVASSVNTQTQNWAGQNSAYGSSSSESYSQPPSQYSQQPSYNYSATNTAVQSQYGYTSNSLASSSGGTNFAGNRNTSVPAVPPNYQTNRTERPSTGRFNQRDQYSNRGSQIQGYTQDSNKGYTTNSRPSSGRNQNYRTEAPVQSWKGNEVNKTEPPSNRRGLEQRPASNNFRQGRQPPKFDRKAPFQVTSNQGTKDSYHQQKNERFGRGRSEEEGRNSGQRRDTPDQRSVRRQGTFGQLKELQRSDVPAPNFTQKRDYKGNFRANQARDIGRGHSDNLRPVMTSFQANQSKNQPSSNKFGYEETKPDARGGENKKQGQDEDVPKGSRQDGGPQERNKNRRNSQQSSETGNKFTSDKMADNVKPGMGSPNDKFRVRGPHPGAPRGRGPMSPRGRFPPPRFPGDEMPFMPRPFGPRGPFPEDNRMFGPPMRGRERFGRGPRGPRLRFPFPDLPPWELDMHMFPGDMRPLPPYFDEFDDRFMDDEFGPDIPPHMLPPRKRRRSSGSPHRGDMPPHMGPGRRPGSPDHFMHMGRPFEFGPRGPPFRPFPPEDFRPMMPPKLPPKNTIPSFRGTKEGKFGEFLAAKKQKQQDEQKNKKGEKSKVKEEKDCGLQEESELGENKKLDEKCHVEEQNEGLPTVESSRDKEDSKKWIEERKKKYPTAATVASKQEAEKEKERVGAVLTTKEFGKVKKKKKIIDTGDGEEEGKESEKQEDTEVEHPGELEDSGKKDEEEDAGEREEKNDEKDLEKDRKRGDEGDGEETEEMSTEDTKISSEKDDAAGNKTEEETVADDTKISSEKDDAAGNKTEEKTVADGTFSLKMDTAGGEKGEEAEIKVETEEAAESVKKEVIFQPVKTEIVRKFKRDKSSKREAWRTSKPVHKIVSKGGRNRRATLLEMLLAPEIRHERNMVLQCVRHIINRNFFEPEKKPVVEEKKDLNGKNDVVMKEDGGEGKPKAGEKEVAAAKEEVEQMGNVKQDVTEEEKDEDAEMMEAEALDEGGDEVEKEQKEESVEKEAASREENGEDDQSQETKD